MNRFSLIILAADRPFYDGECTSLEFPTLDRQYGVQAHHSNMIAAVVPGVIRFRDGEDVTHYASVSEGIIKVEDNRVLVLVDTAEKPEEIDELRARRNAEEAKDALLGRQSIRDYQIARAQMARAISRLKVKGKTAVNDH